MRVLLGVVVMVLGGSIFGAGRAAAADTDDFQPLVYQPGGQPEKLPYRLLKPPSVEPGRKYPLVVFLHGAGERGTDNQAQLKHVVRVLAQPDSRQKRPCYVLAPQCPAKRRWVEVDWGAKAHRQPEKPSLPMSLLLPLIEQVRKQHPIAPARIYVVGLSMGGFGVWDLLARRSEWFAAAAIMCGGADEATAPRLAKIPVWDFHGAKDTTVWPSRSRNMIAALREAGGTPRYTEYPNAAHDCWSAAASDPALWAWLFSQEKK